MIKKRSLIQTLVAVELGCGWEYDEDDETLINLVPDDQRLLNACKTAFFGYEIRLTSKPWDFPAETRPEVVCWRRGRSLLEDDWTPYWEKSFIERDFDANAYGYLHQYVTPDPRNPDEVPPEDWSPEGRRVIK